MGVLNFISFFLCFKLFIGKKILFQIASDICQDKKRSLIVSLQNFIYFHQISLLILYNQRTIKTHGFMGFSSVLYKKACHKASRFSVLIQPPKAWVHSVTVTCCKHSILKQLIISVLLVNNILLISCKYFLFIFSSQTFLLFYLLKHSSFSLKDSCKKVFLIIYSFCSNLKFFGHNVYQYTKKLRQPLLESRVSTINLELD